MSKFLKKQLTVSQEVRLDHIRTGLGQRDRVIQGMWKQTASVLWSQPGADAVGTAIVERSGKMRQRDLTWANGFQKQVR